MDVRIRAATPGEEDTLVLLYEWLFSLPGRRPERWDPDSALDALREAIAAPDRSAVLVAEDGDTLVGFCTAYLDLRSVRFGSRVWVEDLAVDPGHRSKGIGKGLLDAAKQWGRERGATHLELDSATTRTDAHRFYERERPSWTSYCFSWEL
ncbi:MAG TPA: GNAT family N-acetyltransferase [Actinomycetota bacterium]